LFIDGAVPFARVAQTLAAPFLILGLLLVPAGFGALQQDCPAASVNVYSPAVHCGVHCAAPNHTIAAYSLCPPFKPGSACFLSLGGCCALLLAVAIGSTLRHAAVQQQDPNTGLSRISDAPC